MTARSNAEWLADLRAGGAPAESALADLRAAIIGGLRHALVTWLPATHPNFAALTEDAVQETLVRVLKSLDTFEDRSLFTTWAHKIAVRVALTELRRQRWRDSSLDEMLDGDYGDTSPGFMADPHAGPHRIAVQTNLMAHLMRAMKEELTERQYTAMKAVALMGMPVEEVARRMGTERNALYKLMHDARLRLKRRLERDGLTPAEILASYAER